MNQDTHLYIEANQKHGRGYQVHIVIDGIVDSTMADEPFSLYDALGGAQFTLEAVNKERGTNYLLPDVLLVSREAAMAERQTDFLSAKLLRENSSKTGPLILEHQQAQSEAGHGVAQHGDDAAQRDDGKVPRPQRSDSGLQFVLFCHRYAQPCCGRRASLLSHHEIVSCE